MLFDYHVHTNYSDDSDYVMRDVVRDAIKLGISEICFTDHTDYGIKFDVTQQTRKEMPRELQNVYYPGYFTDLENLQQEFGDQITIRKGMEFGIQKHHIADFEKLFACYPFDFIILSCHSIDNKGIWNQHYQEGKTQREYNEAYYQEILTVARSYKNYSVLGHLDMIKRYDLAGEYPLRNVKELIVEILKTAIADGKGIEVNTSCFRYGLPDLTPCREILQWYQELGGEIITIGSDSHAPEHLGAYIPKVMEMLKSMGFTYVCTFEEMKPIFHEV